MATMKISDVPAPSPDRMYCYHGAIMGPNATLVWFVCGFANKRIVVKKFTELDLSLGLISRKSVSRFSLFISPIMTIGFGPTIFVSAVICHFFQVGF